MPRSKRYFLPVFLLILSMVFTACGTINEGENAGTKELDPLPKELAVEAKDELFKLILYLDKDRYAADEVINCYATLEYIGEEDSITVYSGDPLVGFGIKDDKYFEGGYSVHTILMNTTFLKGQSTEYQFVKSGGWSGDDPNKEFYETFYSEPELILPAGEYEISAAINCSLVLEDIIGSEYTLSASANITVTK